MRGLSGMEISCSNASNLAVQYTHISPGHKGRRVLCAVLYFDNGSGSRDSKALTKVHGAYKRSLGWHLEWSMAVVGQISARESMKAGCGAHSCVQHQSVA